MLVAERTQSRQETLLGRNDAHVRRDRLNDDRRDLAGVRVQKPLYRGKVVVLRHERITGRALGHAFGIRLALRERTASCADEHRVRVAVIAALEFDDLLAAGRAARQTKRTHDGFRARIYHADHLDTGQHGHHFLRHFDFEAGRRTERQTADHAVVHGFQNVGMAVAEDHRPPRTHVVDVLQTVRVQNVTAEALDDKAWRAADRTEGADRRIDAARQHLAAAFKQFLRVGHISQCLLSEWRPQARRRNR